MRFAIKVWELREDRGELLWWKGNGWCKPSMLSENLDLEGGLGWWVAGVTNDRIYLQREVESY